MARESNPREMSDAAVRTLIEQDICPMCMGELDTGWECNSCNYDAKELADKVL
jgi:hypothetical protein